jgi:uncharacterized protein YndB with AHSA1/START domain
MTPTGLTKDAGWEIGVSRTVDAPIDAVWELLVSPAGVDLWIGAGASVPAAKGQSYEADDGTTGELRGFNHHDRLRLTQLRPGRDGERTIQVAMQAKGDRTRITFHEERLRDAAERETRRTHWKQVMDDLEETLAT